jgi:hypothetical protein
MRKQLALAIVGSLIVAGMLSAGAISAASARSDSARASEEDHQPEGTWIIDVTRVNPPPGGAAAFKSLMTFTRGGGLLETSNTGTALRGPAQGQWDRIDGRLFATSMVFFRFNPQTGVFLGIGKVNRTMRLSQDGQTFVGVSVLELYDPEGNLVLGGLRATEVGERLQITRIPDEP